MKPALIKSGFENYTMGQLADSILQDISGNLILNS